MFLHTEKVVEFCPYQTPNQLRRTIGEGRARGWSERENFLPSVTSVLAGLFHSLACFSFFCFFNFLFCFCHDTKAQNRLHLITIHFEIIKQQ